MKLGMGVLLFKHQALDLQRISPEGATMEGKEELLKLSRQQLDQAASC